MKSTDIARRMSPQGFPALVEQQAHTAREASFAGYLVLLFVMAAAWCFQDAQNNPGSVEGLRWGFVCVGLMTTILARTLWPKSKRVAAAGVANSKAGA